MHQDMQRVVVGRFRNRSDAEGHLKALKRLMPDAKFVIVFDVGNPMDKESLDE
ncbi:MAG: SPOR domain-containing protein [Moorea sp. SIO4A3]|nr:SPOR domain-containing protein [Moorena sp. SIO4A3]